MARGHRSDLDLGGTAKVTGLVDGTVSSDAATVGQAITSSDVDDAVEVTQAAYDALGGGRPAGRLYLITG